MIQRAHQRISDFQAHVNSHALDIRREAEVAWQNIPLTQTEPRIVYSFLSSTTSGVGHLNRVLASILEVGGRTVKFAGIFLHQKPMVRGFKLQSRVPQIAGGTCELGDLQVLFLYLSADKALCQCRSTIFQAKKTPANGPFVIAHEDQRRLYDKCHGFFYSSPLRGQKRWLPFGKPERERALQYLFIGRLPVQARLIPADEGSGAFLDFGEFIVRLLNDSTGLHVTNNRSKGGNWSGIVWDQIENVATSAFGHQGLRSAALQPLLDRFNSFENKTEFFHDHEGSAGIPLLLIITRDSQLTPKDLLTLHK